MRHNAVPCSIRRGFPAADGRRVSIWRRPALSHLYAIFRAFAVGLLKTTPALCCAAERICAQRFGQPLNFQEGETFYQDHVSRLSSLAQVWQ